MSSRYQFRSGIEDVGSVSIVSAIAVARDVLVGQLYDRGLREDATVVELVAQRLESALRPDSAHQLTAAESITKALQTQLRRRGNLAEASLLDSIMDHIEKAVEMRKNESTDEQFKWSSRSSRVNFEDVNPLTVHTATLVSAFRALCFLTR